MAKRNTLKLTTDDDVMVKVTHSGRRQAVTITIDDDFGDEMSVTLSPRQTAVLGNFFARLEASKAKAVLDASRDFDLGFDEAA